MATTMGVLFTVSAGLCAATLVVSGCRSRDNTEASATGAAAARASGKPLDRLAPDELNPSTFLAFGFAMPQEMRIERNFPDAVFAVGSVSREALANYVRQRVFVDHVEVGAARTVFPRARIKAGAPDRVYRIEVVSSGPQTELVIRDTTPPPMVQGISEAERWRRAGMSPDGKLLNPKQQQ